MAIVIGSARHDERGKYSGGKKGDQLQTSSTNDVKGEVSFQNFYVHSKGWYILRPKSDSFAIAIAKQMNMACNNKNIGYSQSASRKYPVNPTTGKLTNCDCSMLVRGCIYYATGVDAGNFTTSNEKSKLLKTDLFTSQKFVSLSKTPVYDGDVLVTLTKGHTVIVVSGAPRPALPKYYPRYTGSSTSIVTGLKSVGEKDTSFTHRKKIAVANGVTNYTGTARQNTSLLILLKQGKLIKI